MKAEISAGALPMKRSEIEKLSQQYFHAFENKDIQSLENLFSEDIILRDWENEIYGKSQVIDFNEAVFSQSETIRVQINKIYCSTDGAACDIIIQLCNSLTKLELFVVDILTFNEQKKLCRIEAFRGN